ncbi:MAG: glucose-1-phosphate adenylyltransferase [Rhodothermia bacterium]|nr:glucose-1-phosphate adenylyltransferase [Rhodothermia bacterium]
MRHGLYVNAGKQDRKIKMLGLILGGGVGSRLYPLTKDRSKPAVPIGGKFRLIDIPISNCLNSGLRRIFVLTQFNSASLNQHIKNAYHFDSFTHGFVDILAAEQTYKSDQWFQGTADAVRQSMHHLENHDYDYILILSGDQLYQMSFEEMAEAHIATGADLTIATIPVHANDATSFGIMKVDENQAITRFIEKPKTELLGDWASDVPEKQQAEGKVYLASMGIYIFNRKTLKDLFKQYPDATDFGKNIIPIAIQDGLKVSSYLYDGYWTDIGNIQSFYEANLEMTNPISLFDLYDKENPVYTRRRNLPTSKIMGTRVWQSILAEGTIIEAKEIAHSVIGVRSRIGKDTVIKDAILMGHDYYETLEQINTPGTIPMGIGHSCYIERAIVDKNARIGNTVIIRGAPGLPNKEEEGYSIVDGIVIIKKKAVIPSGTVIGAV